MLADRPPQQRYLVADLVLDMARHRVSRGDETLPLTKLTFKLLCALVERAPNLVSHDELVAKVWGPRRIVTPENLAQRLLILRQALGDSAAHPRYIESVRGYGYRLIPSVEVGADSQGEPQSSQSDSPAIPTRRPVIRRSLSIGLVGASVLIAVLSWNLHLSGATSPDAPTTATISSGKSAAGLPNSIAVLPFQKLGPEPDNEFFAEAVHAELVNELGKNSDLNVIARASVLHYANSSVPLQTIADELGVGAIMQGTIRYAGDRVHLIAELVDARTGMQLWTDDYDAGIDDMFAVQWDITKSIANALEAKFSDEEEEKLQILPTTSSEAYAFYMKAMDHLNQNTAGSRTTAQTFLDQAIALDDKFSYAYAGKALVYAFALINSNDASEDLPAARTDREQLVHDYVDMALELNPDTDLAYYTVGILDMFSWRWTEAREAFERAIELTPQHVGFLSQLAWFDVCALNDAQGLRYAERAVALDPKNPYVYKSLSDVMDCLGEAPAALAAVEKALALDPTSFADRLSRAFLAARVRGRDEGLRELRNLEPLLSPQRVLSLPAVALAYARLGREDDARRLFQRFVSVSSKRRTGPANWYLAYLAVGDYDSAYRALKQAVEDPGPGPGFYTLVAFEGNVGSPHPFDEPRFVALRERLQQESR